MPRRFRRRDERGRRGASAGQERSLHRLPQRPRIAGRHVPQQEDAGSLRRMPQGRRQETGRGKGAPQAADTGGRVQQLPLKPLLEGEGPPRAGRKKHLSQLPRHRHPRQAAAAQHQEGIGREEVPARPDPEGAVQGVSRSPRFGPFPDAVGRVPGDPVRPLQDGKLPGLPEMPREEPAHLSRHHHLHQIPERQPEPALRACQQRAQREDLQGLPCAACKQRREADQRGGCLFWRLENSDQLQDHLYRRELRPGMPPRL